MNASRILLCCTLAFLLVPAAQAQTAKRPMTFEDMMEMKRLGDTAVSPDGKWLAYSVTTVDLAKNTKTPELWLQKIEGGEPFKIAVTQPGDSGVQFSPDGKSILFLSGRSGSSRFGWRPSIPPPALPAICMTLNRSMVPSNSPTTRSRRITPSGRLTASSSSSLPTFIPTARHSQRKCPPKAPRRTSATPTATRPRPPAP